MTERPKVRTCLWFESQGAEAAEFYVSLLPDSRIETRNPIVVEFTLAGTPYMTLDGGKRFEHSPAASISVLVEDQEELDRLWNALTSKGGEESMCGWLVDRYGVSWQIVPAVLPKLIGADDRVAAQRAQDAMLKMRKLDIATLEAAFAGQ